MSVVSWVALINVQSAFNSSIDAKNMFWNPWLTPFSPDACGVMEQKDEGGHQIDSPCGVQTQPGHAGLCEWVSWHCCYCVCDIRLGVTDTTAAVCSESLSSCSHWGHLSSRFSRARLNIMCLTESRKSLTWLCNERVFSSKCFKIQRYKMCHSWRGSGVWVVRASPGLPCRSSSSWYEVLGISQEELENVAAALAPPPDEWV